MQADTHSQKPNADALLLPAAPSLGLLLRVWLALSAASWGGGVATLTLMRQAVVERHAWLADAEFTRLLALVRLVPGINILALTILIGKRTAGWRGVVVCVIGLLLPSVLITIAMTACYARIEGRSDVRAALRGVVPATVGVGFITMWQTGRAPIEASRKEGAESLAVSLILLILSGVAAARLQNAVVPILCGTGAAGALAHWLRSRRLASPVPSVSPTNPDSINSANKTISSDVSEEAAEATARIAAEYEEDAP